MAKVQFNCRLESDIAKWIADEAARLTETQGVKYSQADIVARLVVQQRNRASKKNSTTK